MNDIFDRITVSKQFRGSFCKNANTKEAPDTPAFRNEPQNKPTNEILTALGKRNFDQIEERPAKVEFLAEILNSNKKVTPKKDPKSILITLKKKRNQEMP
jgi:hypothetical protein